MASSISKSISNKNLASRPYTAAIADSYNETHHTIDPCLDRKTNHSRQNSSSTRKSQIVAKKIINMSPEHFHDDIDSQYKF